MVGVEVVGLRRFAQLLRVEQALVVQLAVSGFAAVDGRYLAVAAIMIVGVPAASKLSVQPS